MRFYSCETAANSSVREGTVLKGCNVYKNAQDPVAMKDEEYPAWLWEVLDPEIQRKKLEADSIKAARKRRRELNRQKIKQQNFLAKMRQ